MAISVDWPTKVITVPKADTTLVDIGPPEIRSLDVDQFRKDLNALQAGEVGIVFETTHTHNPPVTISGITLARVVELINGYTVTFQNGFYAVNLTGANNNISDVMNLNFVSLRSANSAGLIVGPTVFTENTALPVRNTALDDIPFAMGQVGLTPVGQRYLDNGTLESVTGTIREVGDRLYAFDAEAADMDGVMCTFIFSASGVPDALVTFRTRAA